MYIRFNPIIAHHVAESQQFEGKEVAWISEISERK